MKKACRGFQGSNPICEDWNPLPLGGGVCQCLGIEQNEQYFEIVKSRLISTGA